MGWVIKRLASTEAPAPTDAFLRLRGLPFKCSKEEIAQFFTGLEIVPNGIMLQEDRRGRKTGQAYVQFAAQEMAEKALSKHMERIGHRYIEIFKSTSQEAFSAVGQPRSRGMGGGMGNYKGFYDDDYGGGFGGNRRGKMGHQRGSMPGSQYTSTTGHSVHMRGLPYQAIDTEVRDFFAPQKPVRVKFEYYQNGQATGEANVDFTSHQEALEAMKHHRKHMQHRYIELFCNSTPGGLEGDMEEMAGNPAKEFGGNVDGEGVHANVGSGGGSGYTSGGSQGGGNVNSYMGGGFGHHMGGGGGIKNMMWNPNYTVFSRFESLWETH